MAIVDLKKLNFKIQELPEGESQKTVHLPEDYFDLGDGKKLLGADIHVNFLRADHFIKCSFTVDANLELICDRSLDPFEIDTDGSFDILFEPDDVEEIETEESAVRQIPADTLIIDIDKEVRDTILLKVPRRKIHPKYVDEDGNLTEFETKKFGDIKTDDSESIDPRWEKLKKLKQND